MDLKHLTDNELELDTEQIANHVRKETTRLLHHLLEIDDRRLYAKRTYPSLYEYCRVRLKMSEGQAARRVNAARLMRAVPNIELKLDEGSLSMTAASQAQSLFKKEQQAKKPKSTKEKIEILEKLENQSTRKVDQILLSHSSEPQKIKNERERAVTPSLTEVRLTLDEETMADFKRLKEIWAHVAPGKAWIRGIDLKKS